jgi:hypothetical protein
MRIFFVCLAAPVVAMAQPGEDSVSDESRETWVGRAISEGGAMMDRAKSTDPRDAVIEKWMAHAAQQAKRVDEFDKKMEAAKGKTIPSPLIGEMMLLQAYTAPFVREEVKDIVFKKDGDSLICHLLFNAEEGLVDIAYCYNKDGVLTLCRIDSLPKGVLLSMPADDTTNMFIVYFSKSDVTLVLDKTNPFNSIAQ